MFLRDFPRHTATPVAMDPLLTGMTATTLVETTTGWHTAASLRLGDKVQTLDGGLARIVALDRAILPIGTPLIHLPGGSLDACSDLMLLPRQSLLIDTFGGHDAPFALIPATALLALPGVSLRKTPHRTEVITPIFATEEAVWANSGVLIHCPGIADEASFFPRLTLPEAKALLVCRALAAA